MAPELINSAKCSTKVDVYSFGCVVYEIISEQLCYTGMKFAGRLDVGASEGCEVVLQARAGRASPADSPGNAARCGSGGRVRRRAGGGDAGVLEGGQAAADDEGAGGGGAGMGHVDVGQRRGADACGEGGGGGRSGRESRRDGREEVRKRVRELRLK